MTEDRKTWLIEVGDILEVLTPDEEQPTTIPAGRTDHKPASPAPKPRLALQSRRRAKPTQPAKSKLHFAQLMALTYLTGPLAILLTPKGRKEKFMVILGVLSAMAIATLFYFRFDGLVNQAQPGSVWKWTALLTFGICGGFTVWARALVLAGHEGIPNLNLIPRKLRQGWAITLLGLVAPGSGLLLSGRTKLAALTLWMFGLTIWATVILLNTKAIWQHHLQSGWLSTSEPMLETILMSVAGLVTLGILGYIIQVLEGMRRVSIQPGMKSWVKGDYYAVALAASVVALVFMGNPAQMAHQLDMGGDILRQEGFQTIPLQMTLVASHLDPAKPEYSLQAIELYDALGQNDKARARRVNLDSNLHTYVAMVKGEAEVEASLLVATIAKVPQETVVELKQISTPQVPVAAQTMWLPFGVTFP